MHHCWFLRSGLLSARWHCVIFLVAFFWANTSLALPSPPPQNLVSLCAPLWTEIETQKKCGISDLSKLVPLVETCRQAWKDDADDYAQQLLKRDEEDRIAKGYPKDPDRRGFLSFCSKRL